MKDDKKKAIVPNIEVLAPEVVETAKDTDVDNDFIDISEQDTKSTLEQIDIIESLLPTTTKSRDLVSKEAGYTDTLKQYIKDISRHICYVCNNGVIYPNTHSRSMICINN